MRILYASERPPYPFFLGGAARCAHRLLVELNGPLGAQCAAVGSADYAVTPWSFPPASEHASLGVLSARSEGREGEVDCAYPVRVVADFARRLDVLLTEFRPDILWTQLEGAEPLLRRARDRGVQGLYFVHDAETPAAELKAIAALGCHLVCSSHFLARRAEQATGRPAGVVYPCPERYADTRGDPAGWITMVNPHRVKGLQTFLEIARRMPQARFLLLESWRLGEQALAELQRSLEALPNVRFERRVADMRAIYAQTRLLLVPSVWEEGFGMVAVEAQSCGIPVIASARGGLPESVGDGGVLIDAHTDPAAWVAAIRGVLDDGEAYRALAGKALRHAQAEEFSVRASAQRLLAVCSGPAPVASDRHAVSPVAGSGARSSGLRALLRVFGR
jgi:hypothetical protein